MTLLLIIPILALFYVLGRAADEVVGRLRTLAGHLGVGVGFLGLLLGIFTTLPEMAIAVNAMARNMDNISYGNLIGGIPVLLGLILGLSAVFNRSIDTKGNNIQMLSFMSAFILLPLVLSLDGSLGLVDGLAILACYGFLLTGLFWRRRGPLEGAVHIDISSGRKVRRAIIAAVVGAIVVIVSSDITVRMTEIVLNEYPVLPKVTVGLLIFALGTNLPEITVAFSAWRRGASEMSISHMFGSAMTNVMILGLLAAVRPQAVSVGPAFHFTLAVFAVLLFAVMVFQATDRKLTWREGIGLIGIYVMFVFSQLFFV